MTTLWVDAPTGLAGDMLLAGLLDLGIPLSAIEEPLNTWDWPVVIASMLQKLEVVVCGENASV